MDTYVIRNAYNQNNSDEIEIKSENLIYSELGKYHAGCQCRNVDNSDEIRIKCQQIADLIREIENLNNKTNEQI